MTADSIGLSQLALRQEFIDLVTKDLLGPHDGEEEERQSGVRRRYVVGRLAPRRTQQKEATEPLQDVIEPHVEPDSVQEGQVEEPIATEDSLLPSSLGLSFAVELNATKLHVTTRFGYYERTDSAFQTTESGQPKRVWKRVPVKAEHTFPLEEGELGPWKPLREEKDEVYVRGRCRRRDNHWSVTLFLINNQLEPPRNKDSAWIFQPELTVRDPDHNAIFVQRTPTEQALNKMSPEDGGMRMLYRNTIEFATGHGVAVKADVVESNPRRAYQLTTQVIPTHEVERMDPPSPADVPGLSADMFDMKVLSETAMGEFGGMLRPLVAAYGRWLDELDTRVASPTEDLQPYIGFAKDNLKKARLAQARINAGIDLLDSDPEAAKAFQFANEAMATQRLRSIYTKAVRQGKKPKIDEEIDLPRNRSWRPFQLAFVLLNIPALVDPTHPERQEDADLLWFPTGGGKTEAYLGVAAFTMGIRRLQRDRYKLGYQGVNVLMRYTLRLLTLQQFQRATTLIAACEVIRRRDPAKWGDEPFRIGLWVGQRSTPNWTKDASAAISDARNKTWSGSVGGSGTPYQLTTCPWCGEEIKPERDIDPVKFEQGAGRTFQYCPNGFNDCPFSKKLSEGEGIPIVVVDEEIYRRLPTLLIATVDKFAQMPWRGETQMLFGRVSGYCPRHGYISPSMEEQCQRHNRKGSYPAVTREETPWLRPPDLIIQDELHLINGPLGTMVGLYETAVDHLATWETAEGKKVQPKVIASTATIRRASEQVNSVFTRKVKVFPPPALDADDNFFSKRRPSSDAAPGRLYMGIMAPGKSRLETLIPVYVAYMAAAQQMYEEYGAAADPWMTVVGYFNSLRELGSMRRAVEDSVQTRLLRYEEGEGKRYISVPNIEELTSRKSAEDIPKTLDRLDRRHDPALRTNDGQYPSGLYPLDVVLATNMISVGVDVDRLGLMIAAGQPKATAEYIQATSRVGRQFPGVVATVYSWSRPRDLSHYEGFGYYHATFYQQVESLSVTPFAARAVDRGLTGVMASLIRLEGEALNPNEAAQQLNLQDPITETVKAVLTRRAEQVEGKLSAGDDVSKAVKARLDRWAAEISRATGKLGYRNDNKQDVVGLLKDPLKEEWGDFTTLNSLRDVEAAVGLVLRDQLEFAEDDTTNEEEAA